MAQLGAAAAVNWRCGWHRTGSDFPVAGSTAGDRPDSGSGLSFLLSTARDADVKRWAFIALTVIAVTALWAFETVRQRTFTGAEVQFTVGTGSVALMNNTTPIRAILT